MRVFDGESDVLRRAAQSHVEGAWEGRRPWDSAGTRDLGIITVPSDDELKPEKGDLASNVPRKNRPGSRMAPGRFVSHKMETPITSIRQESQAWALTRSCWPKVAAPAVLDRRLKRPR